MQLLDVSKPLLAKVRKLALVLPQTHERTLTYGTSFTIRQKPFAMLMAIENDDGRCYDLLQVTTDEIERRALLEQGHPFFSVGDKGPNGKRVGVVVGADTDWVEIGELVTESYRLLAPEKLLALLPD